MGRVGKWRRLSVERASPRIIVFKRGSSWATLDDLVQSEMEARYGDFSPREQVAGHDWTTRSASCPDTTCVDTTCIHGLSMRRAGAPRPWGCTARSGGAPYSDGRCIWSLGNVGRRVCEIVALTIVVVILITLIALVLF